MKEIERLFKNNRDWSEAMRETDPEYFARRAQGQSPMFFFIGCCDSRVPTEVMTGAHPGEIFTLRNIANQAALTDLSFLTALEYAIEFLDVKHVVVCGHYKCGGVLASLAGLDHGTLARDSALEFLAGYVVEKALAVDNIFVFVAVFSYFAVPAWVRGSTFVDR